MIDAHGTYLGTYISLLVSKQYPPGRHIPRLQSLTSTERLSDGGISKRDDLFQEKGKRQLS